MSKIKWGIDKFPNLEKTTCKVLFPTLKQMKENPEVFGKVVTNDNDEVVLEFQFVAKAHLGKAFNLNFVNGKVIIPSRTLKGTKSNLLHYNENVLRYVYVEKSWERE